MTIIAFKVAGVIPDVPWWVALTPAAAPFVLVVFIVLMLITTLFVAGNIGKIRMDHDISKKKEHSIKGGSKI